MLVLVTGSPGAGKTSNTLWDFLHNPEYANRPRFASDIAGFDRAQRGIGDLDALDDWQSLPDGSVVLVDEAQRFLRPRSSRQVPDWLGAFETHRHRGFDFLFITQHPSLIDSHVRRLIGRHVHYHRPFGLKTASRYTWEHCCESPDEFNFRKAQRDRVAPNPEVFKLYTSTVLDTHKRRLPWKMLVIGGLAAVVAFAGLAYPFLHYGSKAVSADPAASAAPSVASPVAGSRAGSLGGSAALDLTPHSGPTPWTSDNMVPRVSGLPWTAPIYDHLTTPTDFPRLAACISSASGCRCYSQQATPLDVTQAICRQIIREGVFDPWASSRQTAATEAGGRVEPEAKPAPGSTERPDLSSSSTSSSNPGARSFDILRGSGFIPGSDPS